MEKRVYKESTMFDGICPAPKISGDDTDYEDRIMQLRISLIVNISKGENDIVLQFVCFAWPECLEIQKVFMLRRNGTVVKEYAGQNLKFLLVQDVLGELSQYPYQKLKMKTS